MTSKTIPPEDEKVSDERLQQMASGYEQLNEGKCDPKILWIDVAKCLRELQSRRSTQPDREAIIEETVKRAAEVLERWAHDLADTRDDYITAQTTGQFMTRPIRKEAAKHFAHDFGERSQAVDGCVDMVTTAIRSLKHSDTTPDGGKNG